MPYITIKDIAVLLVLIIIIGLFSNLHKSQQLKKGLSYYNFYSSALFFKLLGSLSFAVIYIYILGYGGDTAAYYQGSKALANLLFSNPTLFLQEMFGPYDLKNYYNYYSPQTEYPPIWLYISTRHFFPCKIGVFLYLITFGSFWGITLLMGFFAFLANWKIYKILIYYFPNLQRQLAFSSLFIPSVAIWCSGLMKDTVIFICICTMLFSTFLYFEKKSISFFKYIFILLLSCFFIIKTKAFILFVIFPPIVAWFLYHIAFKIKYSFVRKTLIPILIIFIFSGSFILYTLSGSVLKEFSADQIIDRALITQQDFLNNYSYTGKKYDVGLTDPTVWGIIKAVPNSLIAGLFRPLPGEASGGIAFLSGIENFFIILLFLWAMIKTKIIVFFKIIQENPITMACFLITITLGIIAGFTAGLFGTLVRFKAPMLPFFVSLLVIAIYFKQSRESISNNKVNLNTLN